MGSFVEFAQQLAQAYQCDLAHPGPHVVQALQQFCDDGIKVLLSDQLFMVFYYGPEAIYGLELGVPAAILYHDQSLFKLGLWL